MAYRIRLTKEAEADLQSIYLWIATHASPITARSYINRIVEYMQSFELFPERGTIRDDICPGLRFVGFERRISIAFVIEANDVVILRILYAGQRF